MSNTTLLDLPYILPSQSQKHVTHNEALRALDAIVQLSVINKTHSTAPSSPQEGNRYIVGPSASGEWSGHETHIAAYQDGTWMFYIPQIGWLSWVDDEASIFAFDGSEWIACSGQPEVETTQLLAVSANNAETRVEIAEEELSLTGSYVETNIFIPDRAIVLGVSTRTTEAITGATSYDCGLAGEPDKFGGSLGIALNSSNSGVISPTAYYADTNVRVTANGSDFSGGKIRVSIHCLKCPAPTS